MSRKRREQREEPTRWTDNPWVRRAISVLLLVHVTAVFAAPFQIAATREGAPSPFATTVHEALFPYIQLARLDQGYQFFAPNPGPTHLIKYSVEFDDGRESVEGRFPDLGEQWPRLFYHRHMMLSEALNGLAPPPPFFPSQEAWEASLPRVRDLDAISTDDFEREDRLAYDYANHLLRKHDGDRVKVTVVRHNITELPDFLAGLEPTRQESFLDLVQFKKARQ